MSVDISALGQLAPSEAMDLDRYKSASGGAFQMPKAGEYVLRAPDQFTAENFTATRAGNLQAQIDPTITGPTNEGFQLRRQKFSAKTFDRDGQTVSYLGDYLKACGVTGEVPSDPADLANAIANTAGRTYRAYCDWEANHYQTGFSVKGMRNFPKDANGEYQSWVMHPTEKDADGSPLRLRCNLVIKRFIAQD